MDREKRMERAEECEPYIYCRGTQGMSMVYIKMKGNILTSQASKEPSTCTVFAPMLVLHQIVRNYKYILCSFWIELPHPG